MQAAPLPVLSPRLSSPLSLSFLHFPCGMWPLATLAGPPGDFAHLEGSQWSSSFSLVSLPPRRPQTGLETPGQHTSTFSPNLLSDQLYDSAFLYSPVSPLFFSSSVLWWLLCPRLWQPFPSPSLSLTPHLKCVVECEIEDSSLINTFHRFDHSKRNNNQIPTEMGEMNDYFCLHRPQSMT